MRNSAPTPSGQKPIVMHASDALTPDIHPHESRKTLYFVARGVVMTDDGAKRRGEQVTLSHEEGERLLALGTVQTTPPPAIEPVQIVQGAIDRNHVGFVPNGVR
jgi:hypothetical protein